MSGNIQKAVKQVFSIFGNSVFFLILEFLYFIFIPAFILFYFLQLFDMKKFQANVSRELRRAYPDRRRLECQCLSAITFVKSENEILDCSIWVLIINVVAMDMLKSKLPPGKWLPFLLLYIMG